MSFLLDTNVVSEWVKPRPDLNVVQWLADVDEDEIYLSVITFAELRQGVNLLPAGRRRDSLESWLRGDLPLRFDGRIFGVDLALADAWGALLAQSKRTGANLNVMDALLAATAQVHDLTVVSRNTKHFETLEVTVLNPWAG